ncbi:MAG: hypothetical protein EOP60_05555 [Sphingomonadales bacterium]|nr:MAG: hypothetical protein EOP60_05555 [Sphingomonadales bacterium]
MASIAQPAAPRVKPLAPDTFERVLAAAAALLLAAVFVALAKGYQEWSQVPWQVWPHLVTIVLALALTPVMLLRRRGDRPHRLLGTLWVVAMIATAALSFNLRVINTGQFSLIHLLSAWTLIQAPLIWWSARTHRVTMHRRTVRGMVLGALLIAGFFTFPFDRLMGHWLFG